MKANYDFEPKKVKGKTSIILYCLIALVFTAVCSVGCFGILNKWLGYGIFISGSNRGDYLTILGTHCSIVFLTTSLMAMLSEKNRYIYWVEMVTTILIFPRYMSFLALVVYAISTVIWSFVGFLMEIGAIVIGSFLFGIIAVTILFSRMVSIYYQNDKNKMDIQGYMLNKVREDDYKKYLIRLKEITYIKADNREFYDVYDNIELIEKCLIELWKKEPRMSQHIFQPIGFCENIYSDILIDLSLKYPQEMQEYIDNHANSNETIRKLCYFIYPILLDSYIDNYRLDRFERLLCKWGQVKEQKFEVEEYILKVAISNKDIITDYYSKLFNPFNHEIRVEDNTEVYIGAIQRLYFDKQDIFEYILQHNRYGICQALLDINDISSYPIDVLTIIADGPQSEYNSSIFMKYIETILNDEICRHNRGSEEEKQKIERYPLVEKVIRGLVENRKVEELSYFLELIIQNICNLDSAIYLNAGNKIAFYNDFEKWALDYSMIVKKKELENYDREHHSQNYKLEISILQEYLEKLNYKNRRVKVKYDDGLTADSTDLIFKKGHYEEGGLALYVVSIDDEKLYEVTKSIYPTVSEEFDFENEAVLLNGDTCPQEVMMYMLKNSLIRTIGRGRQIMGKGYPIAIVNQEWLASIEEI